jgi:hypothetical protein
LFGSIVFSDLSNLAQMLIIFGKSTPCKVSIRVLPLPSGRGKTHENYLTFVGWSQTDKNKGT